MTAAPLRAEPRRSRTPTAPRPPRPVLSPPRGRAAAAASARRNATARAPRVPTCGPSAPAPLGARGVTSRGSERSWA